MTKIIICTGNINNRLYIIKTFLYAKPMGQEKKKLDPRFVGLWKPLMSIPEESTHAPTYPPNLFVLGTLQLSMLRHIK